MYKIIKNSMVVFILTMVVACNKKNISKVTFPAENGIYIAGNSENGTPNMRAVFWANGNKTYLTDSGKISQATKIIVNNNNVYVSGMHKINNFIKSTYWENNIAMPMANVNSSHSIVYDMAFNNNDLMMCGKTLLGTADEAIIWKPSPYYLTNGSFDANAQAISIDNGDIYAAGYEDNGSFLRGRLWKNNSEIFFYTGDYGTDIRDLEVVNGKYYIIGTEDCMNCTFRKATCWSIDSVYNLTINNQETFLTGVVRSNNDIYISGYTFDGTKNIPIIWKNFVPIYLQTTNVANESMECLSVFVKGNDVYACGSILTQNGTYPVYWKNTTMFLSDVTSPTGKGIATSIFIP